MNTPQRAAIAIVTASLVSFASFGCSTSGDVGRVVGMERKSALADSQEYGVIDVACIITPRPKMTSVSAVMTYDYASEAGESPFVAQLDHSGDDDERIVFEFTSVEDGIAADRSVELERRDYKFTIAWTGESGEEKATLSILSRNFWGSFKRPVGTWELRVTKKPDPFTNLATPHVFSLPQDDGPQPVHIKLGESWATFTFERIK